MKTIKSAGYVKNSAKFEMPPLADGTVSLDFAAAEAWAEQQPEEVLRYGIRDAKAALEAMPNGPKAGFYQDEVHVYAQALQKRRNKRTAQVQEKDVNESRPKYWRCKDCGTVFTDELNRMLAIGSEATCTNRECRSKNVHAWPSLS